VPVYLCGHRCLEQVGVLPVGGNLGYGVAILSYNHDRYFGMSADSILMPDIDRMKGHVQAAFEELKLRADRQRLSGTPGKQAALPTSRSMQSPNARTRAYIHRAHP
jgi:hypothetical protein